MMSDIAIRVENLSKQYRIGAQQQGRSKYKSLREELTKAVGAPFRRAASLLRGQAYGSGMYVRLVFAVAAHRSTTKEPHQPDIYLGVSRGLKINVVEGRGSPACIPGLRRR